MLMGYIFFGTIILISILMWYFDKSINQSKSYMKWAHENYVEMKAWQPWFAWYFVKIEGKWYIFKKIQRQSYCIYTIDGDLTWQHEYKF